MRRKGLWRLRHSSARNPARHRWRNREVDRTCRACRCQAAQASSYRVHSTVSGQRRGDRYGQSWPSSFRFTVTAPRIRASYSPEVVLLVAAVREDDFSREPARIIRGKKYGHARDVLGLAQAAQWRTGDHLLLKLRAHDARRVRTLRFGSTGTESVNADVPGAELFGEHTRQAIDSALRRHVDRKG